MADEATTQETAVAETSGDSIESTETTDTEVEVAAEEVNWQAKFEAQQKITRDLERKVKGEAGSLREQLAELQAKIDGREAEFAAAQEAQKVKDEALSLANDRIKKAEIRAAAKGKVADEALADLPVLMADALSSIEVGADGEVDASQVADAINDLITRKPYLAAQGSRFQGSADGGARKDAAKVAQLTDADMARMTPEQIVEARSKGQFDDLLRGS